MNDQQRTLHHKYSTKYGVAGLHSSSATVAVVQLFRIVSDALVVMKLRSCPIDLERRADVFMTHLLWPRAYSMCLIEAEVVHIKHV